MKTGHSKSCKIWLTGVVTGGAQVTHIHNMVVSVNGGYPRITQNESCLDLLLINQPFSSIFGVPNLKKPSILPLTTPTISCALLMSRKVWFPSIILEICGLYSARAPCDLLHFQTSKIFPKTERNLVNLCKLEPTEKTCH